MTRTGLRARCGHPLPEAVSLTLSPQELREITHRERRGAQRRALERMGIAYFTDADGNPVVLRALVEKLGGVQPTSSAMLAQREPQLRP